MTLTTEQLRAEMIEKIAVASGLRARDGRNVVAEAIYDEVVAPLLANRESQPVLYASEETLAYAKEGEKSLVTWSEPMGDAVIPLFTVPKAQTSGVVNLPTEFISDEGVMVRLEQVMAALALFGVKYERRGDACRAAMLAQPVSGGYKLNFPEIPDGWKLVPVDLTPEMLAAWDSAPNCGDDDTVNMMNAYREMLAAAPEGGNGA
ncbi:MAG: hypothetical protein ACTH4K_16815 [Serratia bockelmannii]